MELHPKLIAAADMCEAGEEVNLDEMAFLFRYAADELTKRPQALADYERLLESLRRRVEARCDLLDRPESDLATAREGSLAELEALDAALERELKRRYLEPGEQNPENLGSDLLPVPVLEKYRSGR